MNKATIIATFALAFILFAASCQEEDDSAGNTYEFEDCIPAIVSSDDRAALSVIMKLVGGEYEDSDGRKNVITCNQGDEWVIPGSNYMDTFWSIPLRIAVAGVFEEIAGQVELDALPMKEMAKSTTLLLFFRIGEQGYEAYKEQVDEQTIRWVFRYPDEGIVWRKTAP